MSGNTSRLSKMCAKTTSYGSSRNKRFRNSPRKYGRRRSGILTRKSKKVAQYDPECLSSRSVLTILNQDLENSDLIESIITNIPEVEVKFDVPDYVKLDVPINEEKVEMDLIHKYMTNPVCDENGYYINDHDYLGLPIIRKKTEKFHRKVNCDHTYSLSENPACLYADLRHFCNICQQNNLNIFTFNTHMMEHTMQNDVVCWICSKKFLTTTCLNNHFTAHKIVCDICGSKVPCVQIFAHQEANKFQMKAIKNRYRVSEKLKINFCVICMKSFKKSENEWIDDYAKHFASHLVVKKNKGKKKFKEEIVQRFKKFLPF